MVFKVHKLYIYKIDKSKCKIKTTTEFNNE